VLSSTKLIKVKLTRRQKRALESLNKRLIEDNKEGRYGSIMAQVYVSTGDAVVGYLTQEKVAIIKKAINKPLTYCRSADQHIESAENEKTQ